MYAQTLLPPEPKPLLLQRTEIPPAVLEGFKLDFDPSVMGMRMMSKDGKIIPLSSTGTFKYTSASGAYDDSDSDQSGYD